MFKKKKPFNRNKNKKKGNKQPQENIPIRVRTPKDKEVIGVINQKLGGSRTKVACLDGQTRICRIPGRLKKHLWIREGDTVLVEPWEFQGDEKGDIIYKYNKNQVEWLKRKGFLKKLEEFEEF